MNFSKREVIILAVGLCGLLMLLILNVDKWRGIPAAPTPAAGSAVPRAFTAPHPFRLDGLVFFTNRERSIVCAGNEATGAPVWESRGEDRFIIPGAAFPLDLSPEHELWVANVGRKRLEQLNPKTGRFIASWEPLIPFGGCCNPVRFAALARGRFVTMEKGTRRICIYLPSGKLERIVTASLSAAENNYYLYHTDQTVYIYDAGTSQQWEVPYE